MAASEMILREAIPLDRPKIIELWGKVFGDEKTVIERILDDFAGSGNIYVAEEDGIVVSQLLAVPCVSAGSRGAYLYALGTDSDYRKKGIMRHLMEYSEKRAADAGLEFFVLIPASRSLFDYYEAYGFDNIYMNNIELIIPETTGIYLREGHIPEDIFINLRTDYLSRGTVCFNKKRTSFALEEQWYYGCESVYCEKGYAIYFKVDDLLFVTEVAAESQSIAESIIYKTSQISECEDIRVTLPLDSNLFINEQDSAQKTLQAQYKWWGRGNPPKFYIRFALDDLPMRIQDNRSDQIV